MPAHRLLGRGPLAYRLPFLILWMVVIVLTLYLLLDIGRPNHDGQINSTPNVIQESGKHRLTRQETRQAILLESSNQEPDISTKFIIQHDQTEQRSIKSQAQPSTTRKSLVSEYVRRSEVFILIVQSEDLRSKSTIFKSNNMNKSPYLTRLDQQEFTLAKQRASKQRKKSSSPAHIVDLIETLESHRIGYKIDSTRHGFPLSLLESSNQSKGRRKFSVIIIDDFIKYTTLSLWLRDQIDRYCRSNNVGIITYLLDSDKLQYQPASYQRDSDKIRSKATAFKLDRFPLTIEPFRHECLNDSSDRCLIDYQLNHEAPMLRVLKRRDDFVIGGRMPDGGSAYMTMFSNHITYLPLTWAYLREPAPSLVKRGIKTRDSKVASRHASSPESDSMHRLNEGVASNINAAATRETNLSPEFEHRVVTRAAPHKRPLDTGRLDDVHGDGNGDGLEYAIDYNHIRPKSIPPDYMDSLGTREANSVGRGITNIRQGHIGQRNSTLNSPLSSHIHNHYQSSDRPNSDPAKKLLVLSMFDCGLYDGIRRVIFGRTNHLWLDRILLLDSIEHLSSGEILTPLERYIQIDIDDIFVGERGTRLKKQDVDALMELQQGFADILEGGFKFNLGFSGKYFKHGNELEQEGDVYLVKNANKFTWFCHFWSHSKAHLMNDTQKLITELTKNLKFARENQISLIGHRPGEQYASGKLPPTYAIAPHHSGVYPIHEQLYEAWRSILNVQVTSTEEYPHLRPASGRRGFVHKSIKVLPRQTCGLYTHTIYKDKYPGGFKKQVSSVHGGELFETILHNPVNIYMTHMSNYANDRLAHYTFSKLFAFIQDYTNLRLKYAPSEPTDDDTSNSSVSIPISKDAKQTLDGTSQSDPSSESTSPLGPLNLARYYFDIHTQEKEPIWTNPCEDKRHMDIWNPAKWNLCSQNPDIIIVGPQKTGTTALHSFLQLHPLIRTSQLSLEDFEEVQFFNDKHYWRGPDWYLSRFSENSSDWMASDQAVSNISDDIDRIELPLDRDRDTIDSRRNFSANRSYFYVDKSATYFDDSKAPIRASTMLPNAYVIINLIDPVDRAYSWYQHIRAHADKVANEFSFDEIIMQNDTRTDPSKLNITSTAVALKALRNRCLQPGYYSSHLSNWLEYYHPRQIIIIDGQWFRYNPIAVMNRLQTLLRMPDRVDFSHLLGYSRQKGFFCEKISLDHSRIRTTQHRIGDHQLKCLGSSKGRRYAPMSAEARAHLTEHYFEHNRQLARLLFEIGQPLPVWLENSIERPPLASH